MLTCPRGSRPPASHDRSHDPAEPEVDITSEQCFAVHGDPYQVELGVEPGVRRPLVVLHRPNVLEVDARRQGILNPRYGQYYNVDFNDWNIWMGRVFLGQLRVVRGWQVPQASPTPSTSPERSTIGNFSDCFGLFAYRKYLQ